MITHPLPVAVMPALSDTLTLACLPTTTTADMVTFHWQLSWANHRYPLWVSMPKAQWPLVGNPMNAALLAIIQGVMCVNHQHGGGMTLHCEGKVSPSLVWHLTQFQAMWAQWGPYVPVTITADELGEPPACHGSKSGGILAFSGGADSCHTAWSMTQPSPVKPLARLNSLLLVHGFDIDLDDEAGFTRALASARQQADSVGLPLYWAKANWRTFLDDYLYWDYCHGSAIVGTLNLFQPSHSAGLLSNGHPYSKLVFPCGTNPITDPLMGYPIFPLVSIGYAHSRLDKLKQLQQWPDGIKALRVCWQADAQGGNCGRCAKCMRYRVMFSLLGDNNPACFADAIPPLPHVLRHTRLTKAMAADFSQYARLAQAMPVKPDWLPAMRHALWRSQVWLTVKALCPRWVARLFKPGRRKNFRY